MKKSSVQNRKSLIQKDIQTKDSYRRSTYVMRKRVAVSNIVRQYGSVEVFLA